MRIYDNMIYVLQRAFTFVYNDDLLEPEVTYDFGIYRIIYKYGDIGIGIELQQFKLEFSNLTLEQIALETKERVIAQYKYEIDKQRGGVWEV